MDWSRPGPPCSSCSPGLAPVSKAPRLGKEGLSPTSWQKSHGQLMAPLTTSHGSIWVRRGQGEGEGIIPRSVSITANPGQGMGIQLGCISFFRRRGTWLVRQEPAAFSLPGALQKELLCGTLRAMSAPRPGSLRPTHGAPSQNLEQLQELAAVRMSRGSSLKH